MVQIWRFSLLSYKCFLGILHIVKGKPFIENDCYKINDFSNCKCNLASNIIKIRDIAIELGSRDSFQDLEFHPKQQW